LIQPVVSNNQNAPLKQPRVPRARKTGGIGWRTSLPQSSNAGTFSPLTARESATGSPAITSHRRKLALAVREFPPSDRTGMPHSLTVGSATRDAVVLILGRSLLAGTQRYSPLPTTIRTSRQSAQSQPRSPEGPEVVTKESCNTSLVLASGKSSVTADVESSGSTCFW
jgi:hypothetical protein